MNIQNFAAPQDIYVPDEFLAAGGVPDDAQQMVLHQPQVNGAIVDPSLTADQKCLILWNVFQEKLRHFTQKLDEAKEEVNELKERFVEEKSGYDQKLLDQQHEIEKLQANLDEIALEDERKQWIQDKKESKIPCFILGASLGGTAALYAAAALKVAGIFSVADHAGKVFLGGGYFAGDQLSSFVDMHNERGLKNSIKTFEDEFIQSHPGASKKEAFEYAKQELERLSKEAKMNNDDDYGWSYDYAS